MTTSNYPCNFDTDLNLFLVHNSLRVKLAEDYSPGDTSILVEGDTTNFPPTGIITLTDQCNDISTRGISFSYSSVTTTSFEGLVLLEGFTDVSKPKRLTNVTMNVMADHHNNLKDAIIAVEDFIGVKGTLDKKPFGETLEGRINFLRKLVLTPKAWFTADRRVGLAPLSINFQDASVRLGCGDNSLVTFIWDFGDGTSSISVISAISTISTISVISTTPTIITHANKLIIEDYNGPFDKNIITKIYDDPGLYTVTLTVQNEFGENTVQFADMISARTEAPNEAVIDMTPNVTAGQTGTSGSPVGGPYTPPPAYPPTIKSKVNTYLDFKVFPGENPNTPGRSYAGEELDFFGNPIDPVIAYTWSLADDLEHTNSQNTRASYSIGGIYDLILRVDTSFGAYRITTYEDTINIVEDLNLWLWTFTDNTNTQIHANEFGLISETFKTNSTVYSVSMDDSFLIGTNNDEQAIREFGRNNGFAPKSNTVSGSSGNAMLFWPSGGPLLTGQTIDASIFNGFQDTYISQPSVIINRPWNWAFLNSGSKSYFVFGPDPSAIANTNDSYQIKTGIDLATLTVSNTTLTLANYANGADELKEHVTAGYDGFGEPTNGRFAVYRTTWKDQSGYILRNDGVGSFFRLRSFYKTDGTISEPFINIRKLNDMTGSLKTEGQLVTLNSGVFFFNNSGNISAYNTASNVWETGTAGSGSVSFRSLQDNTVSGFDSINNTLLATSDGQYVAYLSYDYSINTFIKFNSIDMTFSKIIARPIGTQFMMGIY